MSEEAASPQLMGGVGGEPAAVPRPRGGAQGGSAVREQLPSSASYYAPSPIPESMSLAPWLGVTLTALRQCVYVRDWPRAPSWGRNRFHFRGAAV